MSTTPHDPLHDDQAGAAQAGAAQAGAAQAPPVAIEETHQDVMAGVVALEEVLSRPLEPAAEWLEALDRQLGALREILDSHFTDERQGELYGEMPARFPQFAGRLDSLEAEHAELLSRTDELRRRAAQLGPHSEVFRLRELNGRLQLLAAILRRHEAEENELLMRAYWDDVGTGD